MLSRKRLLSISAEYLSTISALGVNFLLYPFVDESLLWEFALFQSKAILIAAFLNLKVESWQDPKKLSAWFVLINSFIAFPIIYGFRLFSIEEFLAGSIFAVITIVHMNSVVEMRSSSLFPIVKPFVTSLTLISYLFFDSVNIYWLYVISSLFILLFSIKSKVWFNSPRYLELIKEAISFKYLILGSFLLQLVNVQFYQLLEALKLNKAFFYVERMLRALWGVLGPRIRGSYLSGRPFPDLSFMFFVISLITLLSPYLLPLSFYTSRYVLTVSIYKDSVSKFILLIYVTLTLLLFNGLRGIIRLPLNIVVVSTFATCTIYLYEWYKSKH